MAAALLLSGVGCSEDEQSQACLDAWERISESQAQQVNDLGANAPIQDFNFPNECFDE